MTWNLQQINAGGNTQGPKAVADPFVSVFNDQQHVGYRDAQGTIWDAWYDHGTNEWNLQQINAGGNTTGPAASAGPCIGVFNNQQHFAYVDQHGTIWDSWFDGGAAKWNLQKINSGGNTTGPAAAQSASGGDDYGPISIWSPFDSQQHFTYRGADSAVYDAFWDASSSSWHLQKINAGGNTTAPQAASAPFACVFNTQQHIGYTDTDGNLWDCWYDPSTNKWQPQKINDGGVTTGPKAAAGVPPFIWIDPSITTQQHFTYRGADSAVYDAFWDASSSSWHLQKINAGGNTTAPQAASAPFACVFNTQQHIGYTDTDGNLWDCWYDPSTNKWQPQKINDGGVTKGPQAVDHGFVWDVFGGQQHFTYREGSGVIWDAFWVTPMPSDLTVTPSEISFNHHADLTPPDGVIEGPINVTITKNGSANFSGQLNSSCLVSYGVSVLVALKSKSGTVFLFTENDSIGAGTGPGALGSNNTLNWDKPGDNDAAIQGVWADLQAGCTPYYDAQVNADITSLWDQVQTAIGDVAKVIQVVGAIAAAVS
jgi:hypothetical protein